MLPEHYLAAYVLCILKILSVLGYPYCFFHELYLYSCLFALRPELFTSS